MDALHGLGNPFNTYSKRRDDARFEVSVNDEIQRLLELSKKKQLSKKKRKAAYEEALSLCESFHGMGFDSCDSAGDCLSDSTDSGNTSVSSVSTVSSVNSWTKEDWKDLNEPETDNDWDTYRDRYLRFIEEKKSEKRDIKLQTKKNEKFASQTKAAGAEAAGAEDRSSRFMGSLFVSDADDEGDN